MSPPTMTPTPAQTLEARRRRIRKGTHSCWECRRRKIRCQYASPDDAVCIGCRARGSGCRSQEFADESPPPQQAPEKKVTLRLDRLENMMEQLMAHVMTAPASSPASAPGPGGGAPRQSAGNAVRTSHNSASATASDVGDASSSRPFPADSNFDEDVETSFEDIHKVYHDPSEIVAHVCPTAAGRQGYGIRDVLDTSTADDTPVAALLGIQNSLSHGGSTTSDAASAAVGAPATAATAAHICERLGSLDASANGARSPVNGGSASIGGSPGDGNEANALSRDSAAGSSETAATSIDPRSTDPVSDEWSRNRHLSRLLYSLFPTQEDINTIASGPPAQYTAFMFHSKHDIGSGRAESAEDLKVIPPMTSHPTLIARRLLQLTLCMQQMEPSFVLQNKLHLSDTLSDVINRIAGVVTHTVTSNDELIGSVEGLECLILLGQQQSNAGQLRKAWLSYRRAMSLAQLMGLDRGNTRALKSCDPASDPRKRPTPAAMWYRINACDRYVSLLLGLRAGSQDDEEYAEKEGGEEDAGTDTPVEKLEKAHMVLTGRIIERNHSKISLEQSYSVTEAIDADLQAAATRFLNPNWWEVPSYDPYARPEFIFGEMSRSVLQVHHHCILILLHLPYMLRGEHPAASAAKMMAASTSSPSAQCEKEQAQTPGDELGDTHCNRGLAYSKSTCMHSSRAVLRRFIYFRQVVNTAFSCRHVDYASLIAAMTLIVGYLGPRPAAGSDPNVLDSFDNQLRQDRAMVEQVRERMEHVGKTNADKLSLESAATIRQLLPILDLVARKPDAAAAAAAATTASAAGTPSGAGKGAASATPASLGNFGQSSILSAAASPRNFATPSAVRLNVPYFGTVNFHTNATTGTSTMSPHYQPLQLPQQQQQPSPGFDQRATSISYDPFASPSAGQPVLDWDGNNMQPPQQPQHHDGAVDLNAMLVDFDPIVPMSGGGGGDDDGGDGSAAANNSNSGAGGTGDGFFEFGNTSAFPDMTGATDDWVMQGIDTTYWSLLNGGGGSFGGQMG